MQYNLLTECVYAFVKKQYTKSGLILLFTISTIIIGVVFIGNVAIVDPVEESVVCAASLGGIQSSLELYNTHYKYYPDNLEVLIKEGYLQEKGDMDYWNNKYIYKPIYSKDTKGKVDNYLLRSCGPDGKLNTSDDIESPINTDKHTFRTSK